MVLDTEIVQVRIWTTVVDNDVAVLSDWAFRTIPGCLAAIAHECRLFFFLKICGCSVSFSRMGC